MIVTRTDRGAIHLGPDTQRVQTRCLARRGMLHSECEAVDHVVITPGACFDLSGREDTEAAWYVLGGLATLLDCPDQPQRMLGAGELLLAPRGCGVHLHGGPFGAELLCLTIVPERVSSRLPARRPDLLNA